MKVTIYTAVKMFCIKSEIFKEDFDLLRKYCPEKLALADEHDNCIFVIDYNENRPGIDKYGLVFNGKDNEGYLTASFEYPSGVEDPKSYVADVVFKAARNIEKIEEQVADAVTTLVRDVDRVSDSITLA